MQTEKEMISYLEPLKLAEKRAELGWLNARTKLLLAELEAAEVPATLTDVNTARPTYSPSWKIAGRPQLSSEGEAAILAAFDSGMRFADVARLFRISERAVANWQRRWQSQKTTV